MLVFVLIIYCVLRFWVTWNLWFRFLGFHKQNAWRSFSFCFAQHVDVFICSNCVENESTPHNLREHACSMLSRAVEPEQKIFRWRSRSLKFGFRFHRHSFLDNLSKSTIAFSFQWTKSLWSRSLKFEFRLHRPGGWARSVSKLIYDLLLHQQSSIFRFDGLCWC